MLSPFPSRSLTNFLFPPSRRETGSWAQKIFKRLSYELPKWQRSINYRISLPSPNPCQLLLKFCKGFAGHLVGFCKAYGQCNWPHPYQEVVIQLLKSIGSSPLSVIGFTTLCVDKARLHPLPSGCQSFLWEPKHVHWGFWAFIFILF